MAGRIAYGLFPGVAILLAVGTALGQGMQNFKNEQAAQRHCPTDTVVWLNTASANYHFKGDPWYGRTRAVLTCAKLRPTKTACVHGQVQNERFWRMANFTPA